MEPDTALVAVDYRQRRICWNEAAQKLMRYPSRVNLHYDGVNVGIVSGQDYPVIQDEDGEYRVNVDKDDLDDAALTHADYEAPATAVEWAEGEPEPMDGLVTIPYPE
ncbi:MAG: hypothetical protein KKC80_08875 [Candidatus Margulisbacteria bacterium]|nr:hypothetical protein [Candidatus Margulisiibacteriota bacterium]